MFFANKNRGAREPWAKCTVTHRASLYELGPVRSFQPLSQLPASSFLWLYPLRAHVVCNSLLSTQRTILKARCA
jgi:hypothetical protein